MLYATVVEVNCRVIPETPGKCKLAKLRDECELIEGATGEKFFITQRLNDAEIRKDLKAIKDNGINSIAIVLAHSYAYHEHEIQIGKIAEELGKKKKVVNPKKLLNKNSFRV